MSVENSLSSIRLGPRARKTFFILFVGVSTISLAVLFFSSKMSVKNEKGEGDGWRVGEAIFGRMDHLQTTCKVLPSHIWCEDAASEPWRLEFCRVAKLHLLFHAVNKILFLHCTTRLALQQGATHSKNDCDHQTNIWLKSSKIFSMNRTTTAISSLLVLLIRRIIQFNPSSRHPGMSSTSTSVMVYLSPIRIGNVFLATSTR